ncbi:hypothetical protein ABZT17_27585 [Streptomyces sp. NPDC005648]|uniref:hypothetical protein n=1 Tax=Streptomyces sp. NPDC005648 TaxID=3157044 RepID=UPI00339FA650
MIGASAAVVCLGAALAACEGGGAREAYVATGAVGGGPQASGTAVRPTGRVTLVPLDGPRPSGERPGTGADTAAGAGSSPTTPEPDAAEPDAPRPGAPGHPSGSPAGGAESGRTGAGSPSPTPGTGATAPAGPAVLSWSDPSREATDRRWCEDVTLTFTNSGGTAVRSGTVTFGTHIIGLLGIDWATVDSEVPLPAPIAAGTHRDRTWTVCVERWRVPLGTHIETRDVTVRWK